METQLCWHAGKVSDEQYTLALENLSAQEGHE